jgi:hypothetical protein
MSKIEMLPDGSYTNNVDKYISEWRKLAKPIEDATGMKLSAFDPDLQFRVKEYNQTISLPVWFVELINICRIDK